MTDTNSQSAYQATKEAVGSAAEQVKSAAPAAYDAAARGTQYVTGTVSEHPIVTLLGTAGLVYLLGRLSLSSRDDDWRSRAESMRQQLSTSRAGDYLRQNAGSAGDYVARGVRDYPTSTLIGVATVGAIVGYLLRGRS